MKSSSYHLETSAVLTLLGIILLFSLSILATVWAPNMLDPSWVEPSSYFQKQMYEVADPHIYLSRKNGSLDYVQHLKEGFTLLAFRETDTLRILAPIELEHYVTRLGDQQLKLTSHILLLRCAENEEADRLRKTLYKRWKKNNIAWKERGIEPPNYTIMELYDPKVEEVFSLLHVEGILDGYVDSQFLLLNDPQYDYQKNPGLLYVNNPVEYRVERLEGDRFIYSSTGEKIKDTKELTGDDLQFYSRKDLIAMGERIFAYEGCWYCHTDQSRTLIQDSVVNGTESFAAPPSSGNEYIYQNTTFPGTRRIGPDLARVGVKRPSRDWHRSHFWQPRTESPGTVMPSFRHFFDSSSEGVVPNIQFEAIFQYLMTKGTRITSPSQAWWLGKDPLCTTEIIEKKRRQDDAI